MPHSLPRLFSFSAISFLASCGPKDRVEVVQSRAPLASDPVAEFGAPDSQRFAENTVQTILAWTSPEGWRRVAATEFRHINFTFGPEGQGECYLSLLAGSQSGSLENFNRWRKQFSLPEITADEMASLPQKIMLSRPAPTISITGAYSAGSGPMMTESSGPREGWRLLGTVFEAPGGVFTIKMTGPADLIATQEKNYEAFLASLRPAARE
jgi:hypothetical protein